MITEIEHHCNSFIGPRKFGWDLLPQLHSPMPRFCVWYQVVNFYKNSDTYVITSTIIICITLGPHLISTCHGPHCWKNCYFVLGPSMEKVMNSFRLLQSSTQWKKDFLCASNTTPTNCLGSLSNCSKKKILLIWHLMNWIKIICQCTISQISDMLEGIFGGEIKTTIKCVHCSNQRINSEHFLDISLPIVVSSIKLVVYIYVLLKFLSLGLWSRQCK